MSSVLTNSLPATQPELNEVAKAVAEIAAKVDAIARTVASFAAPEDAEILAGDGAATRYCRDRAEAVLAGRFGEEGLERSRDEWHRRQKQELERFMRIEGERRGREEREKAAAAAMYDRAFGGDL